MTTTRFPFSQAAPGICELQPYQPGKPVEELERELGIVNAIKLASNENPWGCSPAVEAALRDLKNVALYPDANGFLLKDALASQLAIKPEQLTLGNGSNDVLDLLARVFVVPGDEVIFSEYAFLVYLLVTRATGGVAVVTPAHDWGHDLAAMKDAITNRTKLIFIANPNNPTGTYVSATELAGFLDSVPDNIVIVVDEAYFEYVVRSDYPNAMLWCAKYPNLVVTRTFSKIYGLAGFRLGYGVASEEITDLLNRVRQPFNVNAMAQVAALAALSDISHVERCVRDNAAQLQRVVEFCGSKQLNTIPSVANFVTVEFGPGAADIYQRLMHEGIIVRPLGNYGMPEHLRVTIGREAEVDRLLTVLEQII